MIGEVLSVGQLEILLDIDVLMNAFHCDRMSLAVEELNFVSFALEPSCDNIYVAQLVHYLKLVL